MGTRVYSYAHQTMRKELDALVQAGGVDCWRCGEQIPPGAPWDLGHDDLDPDRYRGPEHQRCNRATKGRAPNQPASVPYLPPGGRRRPRECEVCFTTYHPSHAAQRTCGRACGAELRRRNRPPVERKPKRASVKMVCAVHFLTCAFCSEPFTSRRRGVKFCGKLCGDRSCKDAVWIAGTPRPCTDCAITILAPRVKCDDCLAETARLARRRRRQKYRQSEAGRRQRREYERRRAQRKREGGGRVVDTRAA